MKKIFGLCAFLFSTLSVATTLTPVQLLNPSGSTSGQSIVSTGSGSAPGWASVPLSGLMSIASNTVLANASASSSAPAAFAMPSCSTSTSALQWTSGTGFSCYTSSATTAGTLAQFASTTSAQLAGVISDETGTGSAVFGTSPTIGTATLNTPTISGGTVNNASVGATTPSTGAFTTLSATGLISPTSSIGIKGTAAGDNAQAGSDGEYSSATGTQTAVTSGTNINIATLTLTAGDWDVSGVAIWIPAGTTIMQNQVAAISTTSATIGAFTTYSSLNFTGGAGSGSVLSTPVVRVNASASTTVYLVLGQNFTTSSCQANGFIRARRVR